MTLLNNPFVTSGYIAPEYFCDRERETEELLRWLVNENNVAIISTRRMGKTGLIQHCFHLKEIKENYYTFLIDIYATKTLREFVFQLGKVILATLKPKGQKAWELFVNSLVSLKAGFSLELRTLMHLLRNGKADLAAQEDFLQKAVQPGPPPSAASLVLMWGLPALTWVLLGLSLAGLIPALVSAAFLLLQLGLTLFSYTRHTGELSPLFSYRTGSY